MRNLPEDEARDARGQGQRLAGRAREFLSQAFEAGGWKVAAKGSGEREPDLVCRKGKRALVIEIKASEGKPRRAILQALLADAVLRARAKAAELDGRPLAVLIAPSVSKGMLASLEEYMRDFAPDVSWGVLDARGKAELRGEGLESIDLRLLRMGMRSDAVRALGPRQLVHNPFSDLGQWMLKVLIAPHVDKKWLSAPRQPVHRGADLADQANVSLPSASKFLSALGSHGHLRADEGRLVLSRLDALLEAWKVASQKPQRECFARFMIPAEDPSSRLKEVLAEREKQRPSESRSAPRACLALFAACRELDLGFVRGAPLHLYSENLSDEFLEKLELHPVRDQRDADVIVRLPRFPESVFRGSVMANGVPVADAIQCWLDVSLHPARGEEQAREIARRLEFEEWAA